MVRLRGHWFPISGGSVRLDLRQPCQFLRLGRRRRRRASMARDWINLRSGCRIYRPWWWGQAPSDRLSGTRKARPSAEYGVAAAWVVRDCGPAWPVNQEILRRKALKEEGKKTIAGVGDARLRYTHPFPANEPVTVRAVDPDGQTVKCEGSCGSSSSVLSNLNPLKWVGMGKSDAALGPEPDREWLTDPPKGFRAPVEPVKGSAKN